MARRHKSLVPLSQDHYEGLLLSQQVRTDRIMMKGWPDNPVDRARFVARFYDEHLKTHFLAEEESLFPLTAKHVREAAALVKELIDEHRTIERFISRCATSEAGLPSRDMSDFGQLLEQHIRKEERELFPLIEKHAPKDVLEEVERLILQHYPPPGR